MKSRKNILYVQFPWRMSLVRLAGVYRYAKENHFGCRYRFG